MIRRAARATGLVVLLLGAVALLGDGGRPVARPAAPPRVPLRPAAPRAPRHAWRFRAAVLAGLLLAVVAIRALRAALWGDGIVATGWLPVLVAHATVLWALPALPCAFALAGLLTYGGLPPPGRAPDGDDTPSPHLVCFRVVSRGQNAAALRATVAALHAELRALPVFRYVVEVVTDTPVALGAGVTRLVVPPGYRTAHGSLFKARALQYAVERSALPDDAWIVHLDEESQVTASAIRGIRDAVAEEERTGAHRIGQGVILYHRGLPRHPFLTLADMVRTGDDLGRFHLQHRLGVTLFGLHGSFVLVRNSVERRCDFDVGPEGSMTEDAFWAARQMTRGVRSRWVDGFVVEQSTQSVADFVKQRRRWFGGLVRVVLYAETAWWLRLALAAFVAIWAVSWIGVVATVANLFLGLRTPPVVAALGDLSLATFVTTYVAGLYVNLREHPPLPRHRRALLYVAQVVLLPAFALLEAAGVVAAVVRPERGFHVVRKSVAAGAADISRAVHVPDITPTAARRPPSLAWRPATTRPRRTPCRTPTTSAPTRPTTPRSRR